MYNSNLAVPQVVRTPSQLKILTQRYPFDQHNHLLWQCITRYVIIILYSHTSTHTQSRRYITANIMAIASFFYAGILKFCDTRYVIIFAHTQAWIHNQQNTGNLYRLLLCWHFKVLWAVGMSTNLSLHITTAHTRSCKTVRFKLFVNIHEYL